MIITELITSKVCTKCKETKPLEDFPAQSRGKAGRFSRCRQCVKISNEKYYNRNREKHLEDVKRWNQNNTEKTKEYKHKSYYKTRGLERPEPEPIIPDLGPVIDIDF